MMRSTRRTAGSVALALAICAGCGDDDTSPASGGTGGSAGAAGNAGSAGNAGTAGTGGTAGTAGNAGTAGTGGTAGTAGNAGTAGSGGSGGSGGAAISPVGTPPRPPTGAGEPPVVFWPKPVFAHPDVPLRFTMVAYDPEHEQLLFSLKNAPPGMSIDPNGTITWDPPPDGTFDFEVHVDDGRMDPEVVPVSLTVDASKFLFVSPTGQGSGTLDDPMGDLVAAQAKLADMGSGVLYLREGTYAVHWNWELAGVQSPMRGANGTADAPFVIRGYPGESVVVDCEEQGHGFWSFAASFILFADLEVQRPAASERGGILLDGHDVVAQNVTVRDANWPISSNCTGFLLRGDNAVCHNCYAFDNYDRTQSHWNSSNYLTYPDSGTARIYILDSYSEGTVTGYKIKHAGAGNVVVHGSVDRDSDFCFGGMDDDSIVRFNTCLDNETGMGLAISDPNAFTGGDMVVHNNTIVRARRALWVGDSYATEGGLSVRDNVILSEENLGTSESSPLMTFVWPYTDGPAPDPLHFANNCYHAPNADAGFRFGSTSAGSFDAWQAHGFDTTSVWGDPLFDTANEDYRVDPASPCAAISGVGAW